MTTGRLHRVGAIAGALVLAVIVSGCGGGKSNASNTGNSRVAPAAGVDATQVTTAGQGNGLGSDASACHLLSEADVTSAMKRSMKVSGGAGGAICTYSATNDPSVALAVQVFATRAEMALDTQIEPSSDHLDGLGDDSFWNSTLDMVFVRKGDRAFAVTSPSLANLVGDPQASKSGMVDLAKKVLGAF